MFANVPSGTHLQQRKQGESFILRRLLALGTNLTAHCRFRGAYCTEHEGEFLDIFGEMDVVADSLPDMADKIIAATKYE